MFRFNRVLLALVMVALVLCLATTESSSQGGASANQKRIDMIKASGIPDMSKLLGQKIIYEVPQDPLHTSYGAIVVGYEINDHTIILSLAGRPENTYLLFYAGGNKPPTWEFIVDFGTRLPINLQWATVEEKK